MLNTNCYHTGVRKLKSNIFLFSQSNYNISINTINYVNTDLGSFVLDLNANEIVSGDVLIFIDIGNKLDSDPVILKDLRKINNYPINEFYLNKSGYIYKFYYVSENYGWILEYSSLQDKLDWNLISNKPSTLLGYGISDVYSITKVNELLENISWNNIKNIPTRLIEHNIKDVYTKAEINTFLTNLIDNDGKFIYWNTVLDKPSTLLGYGISDVYSKIEIINLLSNIPWTNIVDKPNTINDFNIVDAYTKFEIDNLLDNLIYNDGKLVYWNTVIHKPNTLNGYDILDAYTKLEIDDKFNKISWNNIINKPTLIKDFNIIDVYNKMEIDEKFISDINWSNISNKPNTLLGYNITDVYSRLEIDNLLDHLVYNDGKLIYWDTILNKPTTLAEFNITDVYTKLEINDKLNNIYWTNIKNKPTSILQFGINDVYTKSDIDTYFISKLSGLDWNFITNKPTFENFYTKDEINELVNLITDRNGKVVYWDSILNKPTTVRDYKITDVYTKSESDNLYSLKTHTHDNINLSWSSITGTPNTLEGYKISNAYTKAEILDLLKTSKVYWNMIFGKPTELLGYGITDVYTKAEVDELIGNLKGITSVSWTNVTNKPKSILGYNITDAYTKTEIDRLISNITTVSESNISVYALKNHTHDNKYLDLSENIENIVKSDVYIKNADFGGVISIGSGIIAAYDSNVSSDGFSRIRFSASPTANLLTGKYVFEGSIIPPVSKSEFCNIGSSSLYWNNLYSKTLYSETDIIITSDINAKEIISTSPGLDFILKLNPVQYKLKDNVRIHYGLIAQEVKEILNELNIDFGGWVKEDINDPNSPEGLRYGEFIAPLIAAIKELNQKVNQLLGN